MRWSLVLLVVAIPTLALADPKIAVAKLDGDPDEKVSDIVVEVASERARVMRPSRVESAMRGMGVSRLSSKSIKKLRNRLDVEVVIHGSVEREGRAKRLDLVLSGKDEAQLAVTFRTSSDLRKALAAKLAKRIAVARGGRGGRDDDDADEERERERERKQREIEERERERRAEADRKQREAEERERKRKKRRDADEDEDEEEDDGDDRRVMRKKKRDDDERDRRKKRVADEDDDRRARKRFEDEDEDEDGRRKRKRKRRGGDDEELVEEPARHPITQAALWADAGAAVARRTLTYASTGNMQPPPVGTASAAGRFEGELYPLAFSSVRNVGAGIGVAVVYGRTFGLGIKVPGTALVAPIVNGHYSIGARYRFVFGQHSFAAGVSYWRRYFMADRSALMMPEQLDMPDVDYTAIAPGIAGRFAVTTTIGAFATVDFPLMLSSGPIQDVASYGSAKILAFDVRGGAQIALSSRAALQIAAELNQVGFNFTGQTGSMSATRNVSAATDRSLGISATIGIVY